MRTYVSGPQDVANAACISKHESLTSVSKTAGQWERRHKPGL